MRSESDRRGEAHRLTCLRHRDFALNIRVLPPRACLAIAQFAGLGLARQGEEARDKRLELERRRQEAYALTSLRPYALTPRNETPEKIAKVWGYPL